MISLATILRFFRRKKVDKAPSQYLMLLLRHGDYLYFGGYSKHPIIVGLKDAPAIVQLPQLSSVEEITRQVSHIIKEWAGVTATHVRIGTKVHSLAPVLDVMIQVAEIQIEQPPEGKSFIEVPLSHLALHCDESLFNQISAKELKLNSD